MTILNAISTFTSDRHLPLQSLKQFLQFQRLYWQKDNTLIRRQP